jgi:phospholipase/carboxylesterase
LTEIPSPQNQLVTLDEWTLQVRTPAVDHKSPVYLLIHGWTGDESVMWVFANRLPQRFMMIAPRGLYPTSMGGYGWQPHLVHGWPSMDDLLPAVNQLLELLDRSAQAAFGAHADFSNLHLMGFSQGSAVAYAFALAYPERVRSIVGLSGFMPNGVIPVVETKPLADKPVFVAHGIQDDTVPVARARQSVELLEKAGAHVVYCEDNVGHKLGAECFRAMRHFVDELPC